MKENFDVTYWLQTNLTNCDLQSSTAKGSVPAMTDLVPRFSNDTDTVISRIEANHTDITSAYDNWLKIGFALSDEHGEAGRTYFHWRCSAVLYFLRNAYTVGYFEQRVRRWDNCIVGI